MSLSCDIDSSENYVDVGDLTAAAEACKCFECGKALAAGDPYYMVRLWRLGGEDDYGDDGECLEDEEVTESVSPCCEVCGDLGLSVLEQGYCWAFGQLRSDIAEMQ